VAAQRRFLDDGAGALAGGVGRMASQAAGQGGGNHGGYDLVHEFLLR
jgi:hypothetical protein